MKIPIVLEPMPNGGFRARSGEPLALSAEAGTGAEARQRLEQMMTARFAAGVQFTTIEIPSIEPHAISQKSGWLPDDDLTNEWLDVIEENRQQADREAGV